MKQEFIATGKNVDVAIANGLLEIRKSREDVDIKIVETGGLFKKAKVILIYEQEDIKPIVNEEPQNTNVENEVVEIVAQQKEEDLTPIEEKAENSVKVEVLEEKEDIHNLENVVDSQESSNVIKEKEVVDVDKLVQKVTDFLKGVIANYNIDAEVKSEVQNKEIKFSINGENVGKLIGYRGENLNAIQYLMGCIKEGAENRYRLYLDVENYKAKREETLIELANKMADKAEEIERNVHLDPMNAYERRIIHTTLQNREKVETESMGEGEKRHVVIKFKR